MDDFFKKVKNNEPVLKNFEVEVNPNEDAGQTKEATPGMKDTQSDNLTFVGGIAKPLVAEPLKEDVIHKPTTAGEVGEEYKFNYFTDTPINDQSLKPNETDAVYEPNELEKMLEEAGETTDFLS